MLSKEDWLKAMALVDPAGVHERLLEATAERYEIPFNKFLEAIKQGRKGLGRHDYPWIWIALGDTELMDAFEHYAATHPID